VAESARRRLAWVHAAAAFYMPEYFRARGDDARVQALHEIADATMP